jgi:hypothetical protein
LKITIPHEAVLDVPGKVLIGFGQRDILFHKKHPLPDGDCGKLWWLKSWGQHQHDNAARVNPEDTGKTRTEQLQARMGDCVPLHFGTGRLIFTMQDFRRPKAGL